MAAPDAPARSKAISEPPNNQEYKRAPFPMDHLLLILVHFAMMYNPGFAQESGQKGPAFKQEVEFTHLHSAIDSDVNLRRSKNSALILSGITIDSRSNKKALIHRI